MDEPTSSLPQAGVPEGELLPEDLQVVRFSLGFRGYRMDEVDQVLDRAAVALVRRDAEIERLRGVLGRAAAGSLPHAVDDAGDWPESGDVSEHRGRHLRPAENEASRDVHVEEPVEHGDARPADDDRIEQRADEDRTERGMDEDRNEQRTDEDRTEHRADEHRADEDRADEHRADEHRADEHRADEHRADEQGADEHRADEHRTGQPGSTGAAPASVAPGAGRPEWSGSEGT